MHQYFKIYKTIDNASAGKVLFRLQEEENITTVSICPVTCQLVIESVKIFTIKELEKILEEVPDLIVTESLTITQ